MSRRHAESMIDAYRSGRRGALEGELHSTDLKLIRAHLLRDVRRVTSEVAEVKLRGRSDIVIVSDDTDVRDIVETYSKVYPEVGFLFEVNKQRSE